MNCRSENREQMTEDGRRLFAISYPSSVVRHRAFTLVESMAAVALLAFIGISVWVILEQCTASAANSIQRMRAFEIARENMEKILGQASVQESTEYGTSELFPDIRWQNTIESFSEPATSQTWVRAVCSAEYTDTSGELKSVELTNWLTKLNPAQIQQLADKTELQKQQIAKHIITTEDLAAEFAGVTVEIIKQWVKNGMPVTDTGEYLKPWLDLYLRTEGNPTNDDKQNLLAEYPELSISRPVKATTDKTTTPDLQKPMEPKPQAQPNTDSSDTEPEPTAPEETDPNMDKEIDALLQNP